MAALLHGGPGSVLTGGAALRGLAGEVDSREWHLGPECLEHTMRRHSETSAHGILVLHFTPAEIRSSPATLAATIADTLEAGRARPALPITARQAR